MYFLHDVAVKKPKVVAIYLFLCNDKHTLEWFWVCLAQNISPLTPDSYPLPQIINQTLQMS